MDIQKAYIDFIGLVNRNATNNNVNVDKARFILLFRNVELRFYDFVLKNRQNDSIRQVSHLLVPRQKLVRFSEEAKYDQYTLPENYFEFSNLHVTATDGKCTDELRTEEVKTENLEEILHDEFSKPDFEFRETIYHLSQDNQVSVYKNDFSIKKVEATYYRLPRQVSMEGYFQIDGTPSTQNIDPEWDEKTTNKILLYMAKEFSAMNGDQNSYQMAKDNLFESLQQ